MATPRAQAGPKIRKRIFAPLAEGKHILLVFQRLGLSALIAENIMEDRRGKNTQLPLPDLLRQSIYGHLVGYVDLNDIGAAVARSDVPVDGLREDQGAWGSVAFAPPLVRDRGAEPEFLMSSNKTR